MEDERGIGQYMFLKFTVLCTEQISVNMFAENLITRGFHWIKDV
jgi:hypothetical protein